MDATPINDGLSATMSWRRAAGGRAQPFHGHVDEWARHRCSYPLCHIRPAPVIIRRPFPDPTCRRRTLVQALVSSRSGTTSETLRAFSESIQSVRKLAAQQLSGTFLAEAR
ncbi:hypothetical protein [Sphingomonas sp.]|uniref:hypothetical protein n=1 Tax=Sphingomonas sp. TaxID=28214 RepID=UPI0031DB009D